METVFHSESIACIPGTSHRRVRLAYSSDADQLLVEESWASSISRSLSYHQYRDKSPETFLIESSDTLINDEESLMQCSIEDETEVLLKPTIVIVRSTFSQSLFNSVNILMGIGLLSLPFAFNITGLILGISLLLVFSLMTHHTGKLLQKCLDYNGHLIRANTYGDLGEIAFGQIGRAFISTIFFFELIAASIALVILSADSITALFPALNINLVKVAIVALILPATIPKSLSIASYGSLVGLFALGNLVLILLLDGFSTTVSPGSILNPADVSLWPKTYYPIPFSFGLLMAGFSGHSVFPNIYRDMKNPQHYPKLLNRAYIIISIVYCVIGSAGYLMFGSSIKEEITQNLPMVAEFNPFLTQITIALVALNPITKYPLTLNPVTFHLEQSLKDFVPASILRVVACFLASFVIVFVSIVFPGFDSMMALLGSFFSFTVSVIFPELCYLQLFGSNLTFWEKLVERGIAAIGILFAFTGTIWIFL